ncbi:carbohydrate-binding protein [Streptomyces sp. NPDC090088]|uniref:carbohydrate-binding protein n=1 Tax=Streptomyces sp. NPDC090088 TaxID=3365944 RepID=UPI0037FF29D1
MKARRLTALLAACLAGTMCVFAPAGSAAAAAATVTVDFSVDSGPSDRVASGFLHGISADSPAQYLVDDVHVTAVRGADHHPNLPSLFDSATQARVATTGAKTMVGLYYYTADSSNPHHGYWPGDDGDWATWQDIVTGVHNEAGANGYDVYSWIPWNEPDLQWNTTARPYTRFLKTFDVAHDTMKAINSSQRIQGPELSSYSYSRLTAFLTYCKTNGCLPDILSWHELTSAPADVEAHTAQIRTWMSDNGIAPMPIAITEYQGTGYGDSNAYNVGQNVSWLARMERARSNGLAFGLYSAWEWVGSDSSFVATLGNATTAEATLPRGVWWNYNAYKEMTGDLVGVISAAGLEAFGSSDPATRRATFLVGNQDSASKKITLSLNNLDSASYLTRGGKIHLTAEAVSNSATLTAPAQVIDADYTVKDSALSVDLPSLAGYGAYRISLSSATSAAPTYSYEAESLPVTSTDGVTYRTFTESQASGGASTSLDATAPGQFAKYTINVPSTGVYNVDAILKKEANRGIFQLYVNGTAYGEPRDEYGSFLYYRAGFGNIPLVAGSNVLELRSVAKNPSSSAYWIVVDKFQLKKL